MKKQIYQGLTALLVMASTIAYGQSNNQNSNDNRQYDNYDNRNNRNNDRDYDTRRQDDSRDRSDRGYSRNNNQNYNNQNNLDTDSERYRFNNRTFRRYDNTDLQQVYDQGYNDGMNDSDRQRSKQRREDYKNFTFGIYAGANSTRFQGEDVKGDKLQGRLGYQLGIFVRGGGRLFGQIGAEYMTSSSDFYQRGDGTSVSSIISNVDQRYVQIPAYVGVKLAQSPRGTSAIRLQVGAEVATPVGGTMNNFNSTTINGLGQIGFDAGPFLLGIVYHHGFADAVKGEDNSKRRVLGVNVGIKF